MVVGRDRDALAAVVLRFEGVMEPVDVRVDRVAVPDERQLREEPVVHRRDGVELAPGYVIPGTPVLELGIAIRQGRADGPEIRPRRGRAGLRCHQRQHRLRPLVLAGVEDRVGDVGERLLPGDRLELAFAALAHALERLRHAVRPCVYVSPASALLAAHRVHIGDALLDDGQRPALFLSDDLAVLDVDTERAATRIAVHRVATPDDLFPLPPVAILIGPWGPIHPIIRVRYHISLRFDAPIQGARLARFEYQERRFRLQSGRWRLIVSGFPPPTRAPSPPGAGPV